MKYEPTNRSLRQHPVPDWFHDGKLGIFIHWGLYSVPGWGPLAGDINEVVAEEGWSGVFRRHPYAEWYWNTLKIEGSPTGDHHARTYGPYFLYTDFAPLFDQAVASFDPAAWADLFCRAGARYVVLTTKHHDGYTLWPSEHPNPNVEDWHASRDLVGDLAQAVRARGMRMGLYYSGGLDWTFEPRAIRDIVDLLGTMPQSPAYVTYVDRHWRELIARYHPSVLWNDIGFPAGLDVKALYADYYNAVPDGVVNDRGIQANIGWLSRNRVGRAVLRFVLNLAMRSFVSGSAPKMGHADFTTPEYASLGQIADHKWEATRGIGASFGYNRNETAEHMLSVAELVRSFVDIVSKNGNLLLNVGPMADGTIPPLQEERLLGLGEWLAANGEAIYGTRPWVRAEGTTAADVPVRFTSKGEALYAILLGTPEGRQVHLALPGLVPEATVRLLGHDAALRFTYESGQLAVDLPESLPPSPAHALRITPAPETDR
jgi:alpha-L-fucosidase